MEREPWRLFVRRRQRESASHRRVIQACRRSSGQKRDASPGSRPMPNLPEPAGRALRAVLPPALHAHIPPRLRGPVARHQATMPHLQRVRTYLRDIHENACRIAMKLIFRSPSYNPSLNLTLWSHFLQPTSSIRASTRSVVGVIYDIRDDEQYQVRMFPREPAEERSPPRRARGEGPRRERIDVVPYRPEPPHPRYRHPADVADERDRERRARQRDPHRRPSNRWEREDRRERDGEGGAPAPTALDAAAEPGPYYYRVQRMAAAAATRPAAYGFSEPQGAPATTDRSTGPPPPAVAGPLTVREPLDRMSLASLAQRDPALAMRRAVYLLNLAPAPPDAPPPPSALAAAIARWGALPPRAALPPSVRGALGVSIEEAVSPSARFYVPDRVRTFVARELVACTGSDRTALLHTLVIALLEAHGLAGDTASPEGRAALASLSPLLGEARAERLWAELKRFADAGLSVALYDARARYFDSPLGMGAGGGAADVPSPPQPPQPLQQQALPPPSSSQPQDFFPEDAVEREVEGRGGAERSSGGHRSSSPASSRDEPRRYRSRTRSVSRSRSRYARYRRSRSRSRSRARSGSRRRERSRDRTKRSRRRRWHSRSHSSPSRSRSRSPPLRPSDLRPSHSPVPPSPCAMAPTPHTAAPLWPVVRPPRPFSVASQGPRLASVISLARGPALAPPMAPPAPVVTIRGRGSTRAPRDLFLRTPLLLPEGRGPAAAVEMNGRSTGAVAEGSAGEGSRSDPSLNLAALRAKVLQRFGRRSTANGSGVHDQDGHPRSEARTLITSEGGAESDRGGDAGSGSATAVTS